MGYIGSRANHFALAARRMRVLIPLVAALLLVPAANAFAAEPATSEPAAEQAAAEPAPAPVVEEQPAPQPAATTAQAPDDISGGNEYTEQPPPTGTGDPAPPPEDPEPTPPPTSSAPATGAADTAPTAAAETVETSEGLPRTGLDGWPIAVAGFALLGFGIAIRRAATTASS